MHVHAYVDVCLCACEIIILVCCFACICMYVHTSKPSIRSLISHLFQNLKQQKLRREKFSAVPLSVPDFSAGQNGSVLRGGKLADPGASVAVDLEGLAQQQSQMQMVDQTVCYPAMLL